MYPIYVLPVYLNSKISLFFIPQQGDLDLQGSLT